MAITIDPRVEERLRERAEAEGLTVAAYIERLVNEDRPADLELEELAFSGLNSREPIEVGTDYWQEKHLRLDERLKKTSQR